MGVKSRLKRTAGSPRVTLLNKRVDELERSVSELRAQNLRLAELADVMQELLIPMASRDQARIDAAIEKFQQGL